jgi:transposase-like protein
LTREIVEAGVAVRLFTISRRQLMLRAHEAGMSTRKLARLDGTVSPATIHSWLQLARDERAQTAGQDGDSGGAE